MIEQEWPVCKVATAARSHSCFHLLCFGAVWQVLVPWQHCSLTVPGHHLMTGLFYVRFNLRNRTSPRKHLKSFRVPWSHGGNQEPIQFVVSFQSQCLKQNGSPGEGLGPHQLARLGLSWSCLLILAALKGCKTLKWLNESFFIQTRRNL